MPDPPPEHPKHVVAVTLLSATAGLIDAVTYSAHGQVFANAMTGNLVLLGIALVSHQSRRVLLHAVPIASFVAGVLLGKWLLRFHRTVSLRLSLLLQMVFLVLLGALPLRLPSEVVVAVLALTSAMQVTAMRSIEQVPFNLTFMTGNLRSVFEGGFDSVFPPVPPGSAPDQQSKRQFVIVGLTCFGFFLGVLFGALLQPHLLDRTFLVAAVPVFVGTAILWRTRPPSL